LISTEKKNSNLKKSNLELRN